MKKVRRRSLGSSSKSTSLSRVLQPIPNHLEAPHANLSRSLSPLSPWLFFILGENKQEGQPDLQLGEHSILGKVKSTMKGTWKMSLT